MSVVTAVLGEESGIQYQGVKDKSGGTGQAVPSTLITGKFRRGVYGRTMTITSGNIRGMLGYDPENTDYQAVEDALSTGIPSVQVLRLKTDGLCAVLDYKGMEDDYYYPPSPPFEKFVFQVPSNFGSAGGDVFLESTRIKIDGVVYELLDLLGSEIRPNAQYEDSNDEIHTIVRIFPVKPVDSILICADRPFEPILEE